MLVKASCMMGRGLQDAGGVAGIILHHPQSHGTKRELTLKFLNMKERKWIQQRVGEVMEKWSYRSGLTNYKC